MDKWTTLADEQTLLKTSQALKNNGIEVLVVENGKQANEKVLEILPKGAEVMNMTSVTLETIGLVKEINDSGNYDGVRPKLLSMDRNTQGSLMKKMGAAPEWVIGSVHAVTGEGQVMIASNTGSQLGAYGHGASNLIWVVGSQKIVKNLDEGFKRIYEHCLVLESERAKKAYGAAGSNVSKILVVNKEVQSGRITMILVKEKLGF